MRYIHRQAVESFLKHHFQCDHWDFSHPGGQGKETYFAKSVNEDVFVKIGSQVARYQAITSTGLIPPILTNGILDDGSSVMVQQWIQGRAPTRHDFRMHLNKFATSIQKIHHCSEIREILPPAFSDQFSIIGLQVLEDIQTRWKRYKSSVPDSVKFVESAITQLREKVKMFTGSGLVSSHNDINNSNWIITEEGQLYLIDLDSMSFDDPALDIGAILWWYYPPSLRQEFIKIAGYTNQKEFSNRMQVRMAMHCLNICLPRDNSFDTFNPDTFRDDLEDFKAVLSGKENPQGYND